jgi:general secretion pathway protein L
MKPDCLLVTLPLADEALPYVWAISGEQMIGEGNLSELMAELDLEQMTDVPVIAIVPATHSTLRFVEAKGLEPRQELAVARIDAQQASLGAVHIAAAFAADGKVMVAAADSATVERGMERLAALGLWTKTAVPATALVSPPDGEVWQADLGGEVFLRAADRACPDEPALRMALFGSVQPMVPGDDQLTASLVAFSRNPVPDFLEGRPRKRQGGFALDASQWQWLKRLALLAALLLLVSGIAYWAKLQWAISRENGIALAAAQKIDPAITDIAQADARIDAALARKGAGGGKAGMLAAIVWQSVQSAENVSVNDLRIDQNGLLTATLAAPDANGINAALLAVQRAGYKITATPRRDPSGLTLVDLTVRMP